MKKEEDKKLWNLFSGAYFRASQVLVKQLEKTIENDDELYKIIYIPLIYNIKHSIELALKDICLRYGIDFKRGHDIKELLKKIPTNELKDNPEFENKLKDRLNKLYKPSDPMKEYILKHWDSDWAEFQDLIIKYYQCLFVDEHAKRDLLKGDLNNTYFRYPKADIPYKDIIKNITKRDAVLIEMDIHKLIGAILILQLSYEYVYDDSKVKL